MRSTHTYAMAASFAAICAAVPAIVYMSKSQVPSAPTSVAPAPMQVAVAQPAPVESAKPARVEPVATPPPPAQKAEVAEATRLPADVPGMRPGQSISPAAPPAPPVVASPPPPVAAAPVATAAAVVQSPVTGDARKRLAEEQRSRLGTAPPPAADAFLRLPDGSRRANAVVGGQVAAVMPTRPADLPTPRIEHGRDQFETAPEHPVKQVASEPVSTFSIDVDTASYSFVRRSLNAGRLPPKDAVRVEEMINYFPYAYPRPESASEPFRASIQVFPSPWKAGNQLVHIGLTGYDLTSAERPRANLVLLVDVSGSMGPADRLPLLKNAFRMLVDHLRPEDTIAIVTYASGSDVRLPPTKVADRAKIIAAIESLKAGGSTHGAQGITDAYRVAEANFDRAAVNRVILATDGDWNVGITNRQELKGFIERKRATGIFLSILGVGMGNHNDALMQALAQSGNGAAAYIDTLGEARKVLVDEASSTLFPIAKDVKIQLEFNPARVSEYRLIGYETRMLRREDFNNDRVDAGDVGSGHTVTAIYEITPVGQPKLVDDLRYQPRPASVPPAQTGATPSNEIGFLKLRYKLPQEEASRLTTFAIGTGETRRTIAEATAEAQFSVAVAAFGQLLRGSAFTQGYGFDDVIALANGAKGDDAFGYRAEFVNLVRLAKTAAASVAPPQ